MPKPTMTKAEANYRASSRPSKSCGTCSMYVPPKSRQQQGGCTLVMGAIDKAGLCDHWEAK